MADILVIAPHPDDETLGCGGTMLRHIANGDNVHWCIVTEMTEAQGFSAEAIKTREAEIDQVAGAYEFTSVHQMGYPAAALDSVSQSEFIGAMKGVFEKVKPHTVYLPFPGDIHSDHKAVFEAGAACTKWFRHSYVKRVMCYEVLSETDFQINPVDEAFQPNSFVDISAHLAKKIEIMTMFKSEVQDFPFPRSVEAIEAQAKLRGAACGAKAAEAFMLLKEIQD